MENTYKVPEANLATLQQRMAKLVRRCNRIKVAAPVLTVGSFEDVRYEDPETGFQRVRRVYTVTLESNGRPKINGYEFAAVLSPVTDEEGKFLGNVLRQVPTFEGQIPERFREASNYCDHCKASRRRLETFVIANEAGFRQIGRNCLANYLGLQNPEQFAQWAEILIDTADLMGMAEDSDSGFGGGGRYQERYALDEVLTIAASAIRQYGWLSGKSAREHEKQSTADRVRQWMFGNAKDREDFEHKLSPVSEADTKLATETTEWLEALKPNAEDDYMYNLSLLARSVSVTSKNFGIAVSAINAYSRDKEREIRRNARIEGDAKSEYIGTEGERRSFENVTLVYTNSYEGEFGVTHLYKMKQGDNVITYFSSRDLGWQQGDTLAFTATIKKHETRTDAYNPFGVKQTVITRAKTAEEIKYAAEQKEQQKKAKKEEREMRKFMSTIAWA